MKKYNLTLISAIGFIMISHGALAGDAEITLKASQKSKDAYFVKVSNETTTQNSQQNNAKKKMDTSKRKAGDVTLKRGVINANSSANSEFKTDNTKSKKGNAESTFKVEKGQK